MPNIKSAKKRVRSDARKALRNKIRKSKLRTALKNARNTDDLKDSSRLLAISQVDRAVSSGLIHKNAAARYKSLLES